MFKIFSTVKNVDEALLERVKRLESKIQRLDADILDLATAHEIIRDKVLRKIQFKKEDKVDKEDKEVDRFKGVLLPDTTKPF